MIAFNTQWRLNFCSPESDTQVLLDYICQQKGGQVRPQMVFLTAGIFGTINEETFLMAQLVELLHLSSLIHDDVIDHGLIRRGVKTVNVLYDSKMAVLLGDYLLSRILHLINRSQLPNLLHEVAETVSELTSGEMRQILHTGDFEMQDSDYEKIIGKKTAALIRSSFVLGGLSSQYSKADSASFHNGLDLTLMRQMGHLLGMAFQYKDDWKDFQPDNGGKGWGNDIGEQQITLPVIFVYNQMDAQERADFRKMYSEAASNTQTLQELVGLIRKRGGLECLRRKIVSLRAEMQTVISCFPDNSYRDDLWKLVESITEIND